MENDCIVPTVGMLVTVVISANETNFEMILSLLADENSSVLQKHKVPFWNSYVICMATINNLVTLRTTAQDFCTT